MTIKALETAILKLPAEARGRLASSLLSSLEADDPAEIERSWAKEASRRYRAYRKGLASGTPAGAALAAARKALRS